MDFKSLVSTESTPQSSHANVRFGSEADILESDALQVAER